MCSVVSMHITNGREIEETRLLILHEMDSNLYIITMLYSISIAAAMPIFPPTHTRFHIDE